MMDRHNKHYDEEQLELFLLSPESIDPGNRKAITEHLPVCGACSGLHADLRTMYGFIEETASSAPTNEDRRTVERLARLGGGLLPSKGLLKVPDEALEGYAEVVEPTGKAIIRRIARYVRVYPLRAAATFSFASALVVFGLHTLRPTPDTNPVYAKFSGDVLRVFNQRGDTLWTRLATGMPERGSEQKTLFEEKRLLLVDDIDGDGSNEVLINGHRPGGYFSPETLYCFDRSARLKWKSGCGPIIRLGDNAHMQFARWSILSYFTLDLPGEPKPRLFYLAQAIPFMTSKLGEFNSDDGSELQTYWHAGGLILDERCDLTGDQGPEIVLGAINNGYRSAAVVVLDPKDITGYGSTIPEYIPAGVRKARELFYVTLSPTDLSLATATHLYNSIGVLEAISDTSLLIHTKETTNPDVHGGVIYSFGRGMEVLSAYPNDPFIKSRERYVREGILKGTIDSSSFYRLGTGVRYLVRGGKSLNGPR